MCFDEVHVHVRVHDLFVELEVVVSGVGNSEARVLTQAGLKLESLPVVSRRRPSGGRRRRIFWTVVRPLTLNVRLIRYSYPIRV